MRHHSAQSPIADARRGDGESRQVGSRLHHGVSGIAHEVTVVHVHPPCSHEQGGIGRQSMQLVANGINGVDTSVQQDKP